MSKKKLLITVGAGASIDFGLPSVKAVDQILEKLAGTICPLADDPTSNLYCYCRNAIDNYYSGSPKLELRNCVNFEEVLYQLNLLIPYLADPSRRHGSNALLSAKQLPAVLDFCRRQKQVDHQILLNLTNSLIDGLVDYFIEACATVKIANAKQISTLSTFLTTLQNEFEIGIITLNYDNLFTQASPQLYTGFDMEGKFDARGVLTRTDWEFVYHLHGSVHFAMTGCAHDLHGITWTTTPSKDKPVHASGRSRQDSMEGTSYPISPFVAGYGKAQQILRQPFRTYFSQVSRLVHEADALLFLGYGFGDLHLNSVFSDVRDRRRPIVVVDWADDSQDALPHRCDIWTHNLFQTLPGIANEMSQAGNTSPACIRELKAARECEVSTNSSYPLAVWYNGFLEACRSPATILKHLR